MPETNNEGKQMTTPREHADLAVQYFTDDTMKCWARYKNGNDRWTLTSNPSFNASSLEYYVGHEPPLFHKRYIGLTVNGREWVLPEPLRGESAYNTPAWFTDTAGKAHPWSWRDAPAQRRALGQGQLYATEADAQAWADFDKWCRGGGV